MKTKTLLLFGCLSFGIGLGANAQQIINSTQADLGLWSAPNNTGLAIAPGLDIQAAVFDDGTGEYHIQWIKSASNTVVDQDHNSGNDPDVAYYVNADGLAVVYEKGGHICIDEYYLTTLSPNPDYALGNTIHVATGSYPNIDIASNGNGIITWENNGDVFVSAYSFSGGIGPIVYVGDGTQPDAIATDDFDIAAITYIDQGGNLVIEKIVYADLGYGNYNAVQNWTYSTPNIYEFPRIASDRQAFFGGNKQNFTVVVQDYYPQNISSAALVEGFFVTNGITMNPHVHINTHFQNCGGDYPLPAVTYHLGKVRVAWSQYHPGGCSTVSQFPATSDDVLTRDFSANGNGSTTYEQVNQISSSFVSYSRNAIASEYDGGYLVTNSNYHGGILYNDPGDLLWKGILLGNPNYMPEHGIIAKPENNFSLVTSPVDQTIEVLSESDNLASFEMLDNAGRLVELKTISSSDNVYSIDISHLSGGMYFLNCSSETGNEILRVLQVTK